MSGRPQAVPTVQVDNAEVIVTEWRFAPGAETGRHRHGHDYVVVPLTDGTLRLEAEFDAIAAGTEPDLAAWVAAVQAIKARYPLPE